MCVLYSVCVVIPFILGIRLVDAPAVVTQEEGHTKILHLRSAMLALIFLARRIPPSLSLVDREAEFLCTHEIIVLHLLVGHNVRKNPMYTLSFAFTYVYCGTVL